MTKRPHFGKPTLESSPEAWVVPISQGNKDPMRNVLALC